MRGSWELSNPGYSCYSRGKRNSERLSGWLASHPTLYRKPISGPWSLDSQSSALAVIVWPLIKSMTRPASGVRDEAHRSFSKWIAVLKSSLKLFMIFRISKVQKLNTVSCKNLKLLPALEKKEFFMCIWLSNKYLLNAYACIYVICSPWSTLLSFLGG